MLRFIGLLALLGTLLLPGNVLAAPNDQGGTTHVVAAGETLSAIAARYGVTISQLVLANGLRDANAIYAGQRLTIPTGVGPAAAAAPREHIVSAGESLTSIAGLHGVTIADLAAANGLGVTDFVFIGQVLLIPGGPAAAAPAIPPTAPAAGTCASTYTVQVGDTLFSIAVRYGTTVQALAQANAILNGDLIYAGQRLCVGPAASAPAPVYSAPTCPPATCDYPVDYTQPAYPPEWDVPALPAPTTGGLRPPEYVPYPIPVTVQPTPQPVPPPTYVQPLPPGNLCATPPCATAADVSQPMVQVAEFAPTKDVGVTVVRATEAWVGNQTADPKDPQQRTTLMVMVWDGKGVPIIMRDPQGNVRRRVAEVNFEFSWVPTAVFRDIAPGFYDVYVQGEPTRIARAQVHGGHRPLVEFRKQMVTPEMGAVVATASGARWVAEVIENTSGTTPLGPASILVVRTGMADQVIKVKAEPSYENYCITGTKLEHGPGACDIGGLNAGIYQVILEGAGIGIEIFLDGIGTATVEFRPQ
jgi:LysM repeat protein